MPETLPHSLRSRFVQAPNTEHGFAFHKDTEPEVMRVVEHLVGQAFGIRINVWYGNPNTGQSFGHSRAVMGVYVKAEQEREHGCPPFRVVRLTKRLGADQSYDFATQNVVMISAADGRRIFFKHPSYRPEFDWESARVEHRTDDGGICIYAPLHGELDERLAHGQLASGKAASQFLKVVRLTDNTDTPATPP